MKQIFFPNICEFDSPNSMVMEVFVEMNVYLWWSRLIIGLVSLFVVIEICL